MGRKILSIAVATALFFGTGLAAVASHGSFGFTGGSFSAASPLSFNARAVGLANHAYELVFTAVAEMEAKCENNGGKLAEGQNPVLVGAQVTGTIKDVDSNGSELVNVTAPEPTAADIPVEEFCPNGNWTVVNAVLIGWVSAQITVYDDTGLLVFEQNYVCNGQPSGEDLCQPIES